MNALFLASPTPGFALGLAAFFAEKAEEMGEAEGASSGVAIVTGGLFTAAAAALFVRL